MGLLTAKSRIALAQVFLLASVLLLSAVAGVMPNRREAVLRGRAELCEAIAVNTAVLVNRDDTVGLRAMLMGIVRRNDQIVSAAVRKADGQVVSKTHIHDDRWHTAQEGKSIETQIAIPIRSGDSSWGALELCFSPLSSSGVWGIIEDPIVQLISFTGCLCYLFNYFYFARKLQDLDPSRAVPQRVRETLDTLTEGILILNRRHRIAFVNQGFAANFDMKPEDFVGRQPDDFGWYHMEANQNEPFPWKVATKEKRPQLGVMLGLRDDSGVRTFIVNAAPVLDPSGNLNGAFTSFEDVTQLEDAKVELRKSKEAADDANRAKSEFLANMSHEIRTPMNSILGFTDVMRRGMEEGIQQRKDYLNTIHASGQHLLNLINDILDLSKIESGRLELELKQCSPHKILSEVVSVMTVKAREKGISLDFSSEGGLPESILTDPTRLRQLVTNLVGNAIKFTEEGGVKVVARLLKPQGRPRLAIDVMDSGIGMAPETLKRVFDPFVQADASVTRRFGGTGLGLAISKRFSEALGGSIAVKSAPGRGSTFTAELETGPLKDVRMVSDEEALDALQAAAHEQQSVLELPPARVLVADDSEANRKLMTLVLRGAGLDVVTAHNGQVAVELGVQDEFDLILMDMQMPVMDGYTATRALREHGYEHAIIALTADAMKGSEDRCREAGCSGFMTKPIEMDRLLRLLAKELQPVQGRSRPLPAELSLDGAGDGGTDNQEQSESDDLFGENPEAQAIVADYLLHLRRQLQGIGLAAAMQDFEKIAKEAHAIKGTAGTLDLDQFTGPAMRLEALAQNHRTDEIESVLAEMNDLAAQAMLPELTKA